MNDSQVTYEMCKCQGKVSIHIGNGMFIAYFDEKMFPIRAMLTTILNNKCVQEEEVWNVEMEAWTEMCAMEQNGECLRGVLSQVSNEEGKVMAKRVSVQLSAMINRLDAYNSVSEQMQIWKNGLFSWLHQLLQFAQELVLLKVSFGKYSWMHSLCDFIY